MNSFAANRFEAEIMPYGKHQGQLVGHVPCHYLTWLSEGDDFLTDLRRYVQSDRFKERLAAA